MVAIRQTARLLTNDGMPRDAFSRKVAAELGYNRTPASVAKAITNSLRTASLRRIVFTEGGVIYADCRSIGEYPRETLKKVMLQAVGRTWATRDESMILTARALGFARTGKHIKAALKSAITGLLRQSDLERDGKLIRKA